MADRRRRRRPVTKAVVPVAGLGTRFLPATKATPKEMLPVVDKPAIQYVVEEAVAAGLTDVLMVTGRNKNSLENHFDRNWELEAALEAKGDDDRLRAGAGELGVLADLHYTRQGDPRGLGHAVLCAARHVGDEPFAVLLGDDLIDERDPLLTTMLDVQARHGGSVVALMEVPREQINLYGCAASRARPTRTGVVTGHRPGREAEPSTRRPSDLAIIGRYVLDARRLRRAARDAARAAAARSSSPTPCARWPVRGEHGPVHGVVFRGRRYDTGDRLDYLKTVVRLASERDDLGPGLPRLAARASSRPS